MHMYAYTCIHIYIYMSILTYVCTYAYAYLCIARISIHIYGIITVMNLHNLQICTNTRYMIRSL